MEKVCSGIIAPSLSSCQLASEDATSVVDSVVSFESLDDSDSASPPPQEKNEIESNVEIKIVWVFIIKFYPKIAIYLISMVLNIASISRICSRFSNFGQ